MLTEGQDHINLFYNHNRLANGQDCSIQEAPETYLPTIASFQTSPGRASRLDGAPLSAFLPQESVDGPVFNQIFGTSPVMSPTLILQYTGLHHATVFKIIQTAIKLPVTLRSKKAEENWL
jgi:hypothetical protein